VRPLALPGNATRTPSRCPDRVVVPDRGGQRHDAFTGAQCFTPAGRAQQLASGTATGRQVIASRAADELGMATPAPVRWTMWAPQPESTDG
jgi:hypothetical protein